MTSTKPSNSMNLIMPSLATTSHLSSSPATCSAILLNPSPCFLLLAHQPVPGFVFFLS